MKLLQVNFLAVLGRIVMVLFLSGTLTGIIISIAIFTIAFFVAFQLNLCSYLPPNVPFEGLVCNRLLQALLIFFIFKKIFVRK